MKILSLLLCFFIYSCEDTTDLAADINSTVTQNLGENLCATMIIQNRVRTGPGRDGWFKHGWMRYKFIYNVFKNGVEVNSGIEQRPDGFWDFSLGAYVKYGASITEKITYGNTAGANGENSNFSWSLGELQISVATDENPNPRQYLVDTGGSLSCNAIHSVVVYNRFKGIPSDSRSSRTDGNEPKINFQTLKSTYNLEEGETIESAYREFLPLLDEVSKIDIADVANRTKLQLYYNILSENKIELKESDLEQILGRKLKLSQSKKYFLKKAIENYFNAIVE